MGYGYLTGMITADVWLGPEVPDRK